MDVCVDRDDDDDSQELRDARREVEQLRQQNHERKLLLDRQTFMVDTLTAECASLQAENSQLKSQRSLQETLVRDLSRKLTEGEELVQGTEHRSEGTTEASKLQEDMGLLIAENKGLIEELAALKDELNIMEADEKRVQAKNKNLEELVRESYLEVATLKEALRCARDQCASMEDHLASTRTDNHHTLEVLNETRDALSQALADLHLARAPVKAERGNSIFTELEDSRTLLLGKYRELKVRYGDLASKCAAQARDMSKLRAEKVSVLRMVEDARVEEEGETADLLRALEARVADLERANQQLTSELQVPVRVLTECDEGALRYLEAVTAEAKEQVCALRRELEQRSVAQLMNQRLLNSALSELRSYKTHNLRLKSELSEINCKHLSDDVTTDNPLTKETRHVTYDEKGPGTHDRQEEGHSMKQHESTVFSKETRHVTYDEAHDRQEKGHSMTVFSKVARRLIYDENRPGKQEPSRGVKPGVWGGGDSQPGEPTEQDEHCQLATSRAKKLYPRLVMHSKKN